MSSFFRKFNLSGIILLWLTFVVNVEALTAQYIVMIDKEEVHAIWMNGTQSPDGWTKTSATGTLQECSDYIWKNWTDMRPASMRKKYKKKMKDGYVVIINDEEQYMIWPREEYVPEDWHLAGAGGSYIDCYTHIKKVWTDMRPLSLRAQMDE